MTQFKGLTSFATLTSVRHLPTSKIIGADCAVTQGRFIHKAEEAEASGPTKPRGPQSLRAHQDQYYLFSNSPLNHSSQPLPLSCGGPQSSVLCPLLFIRNTTPIKPFQNRIHNNRPIR